MISGIYKIENTQNGKIYIGQAQDISSRWSHHKCDLNNNAHCNRHLQGAWNKYGKDSFVFSIVEEIDIEKLDEREEYWIEYYDSYKNGYNKDTGGKGCRGYKHTKEEIEKMRLIQNPLSVLQFNLDRILMREWISYSQASKTLGYTKDCIKSRCRHNVKNMTPYKECYWVYKKEYEHPDFTWDKYLNNISLISTETSDIKIPKKILQYSKDKILIKEWNSLSDIRKEFGNTSGVSSVLYHRKNKKTAYGYIWCFENYDFSDGYFDLLDNYYNIAVENRKRKVAKIDPDTKEIIKIYDSLTEAAHENNINAVSNLTVSAKGYPNHKCKNFLWKYIDNNSNT